MLTFNPQVVAMDLFQSSTVPEACMWDLWVLAVWGHVDRSSAAGNSNMVPVSLLHGTW